jgi:hypothetical protein
MMNIYFTPKKNKKLITASIEKTIEHVFFVLEKPTFKLANAMIEFINLRVDKSNTKELVQSVLAFMALIFQTMIVDVVAKSEMVQNTTTLALKCFIVGFFIIIFLKMFEGLANITTRVNATTIRSYR